MKFKNVVQKYGSKAAVLLSAPLALAASAYAAVPEAAKTAIEGAKTDGLEAGWLVITVFAGLFVFTIMKRVFR